MRLCEAARSSRHRGGHEPLLETTAIELAEDELHCHQDGHAHRMSLGRIEAETLDAQVPNLLMQPLVENAIRHGIAPHSRPGRIAIRAAREDTRLVIEIRDSGDGLPPDRLLALNRGVGLDNTRARLEHQYPSAHKF